MRGRRMKWWQCEKKAILRPEQKVTASLWIAIAAVAGCWLLADLLWRWAQ